MFSKKTVTIETGNGTKKEVELVVADSGEIFAKWEEEDEAVDKAIAQYLLEKEQ